MSKKSVIRGRDIKKLFKGKNNISLKAMSDLAFRLGFVARVELIPIQGGLPGLDNTGDTTSGQ